jgi:RNA polymerase primary sigma factor
MRQLKITNKITSRESIALDKYLNDIGKLDMLTPEQETELARRIKQGDSDALEKLTQGNLRFVVSVSKQYQNQGLSLSDLINEGNLGLLKAARRFDETRGFKFISYAVWWIRQSILQAITEHARIVRMPVNKAGSVKKILDMQTAFMQQFEREPTDEEMAEILSITPKQVHDILTNSSRHISFDAPLSAGEDSDGSLLDVYQSEENSEPDQKLMIQSLSEDLQHTLDGLAPREREVIICYFGLDGNKPLTLEEIGEKFDLTRERVRQIKDRAISRLRRSSKSADLRSYLG